MKIYLLSWKCKNLIDIHDGALLNLEAVETPAAKFSHISHIQFSHTHMDTWQQMGVLLWVKQDVKLVHD